MKRPKIKPGTTKKGAMAPRAWPWSDSDQKQFQQILANQKTSLANDQIIIKMLQSLSTQATTLAAQESTMAVDLTALTTELTNNTNAAQSVIALLKNLSAQLAAIPASSDPVTQAALDGIVATLGANDQALAQAVIANTPAAGPPPPPPPPTP